MWMPVSCSGCHKLATCPPWQMGVDGDQSAVDVLSASACGRGDRPQLVEGCVIWGQTPNNTTPQTCRLQVRGESYTLLCRCVVWGQTPNDT